MFLSLWSPSSIFRVSSGGLNPSNASNSSCLFFHLIFSLQQGRVLSFLKLLWVDLIHLDNPGYSILRFLTLIVSANSLLYSRVLGISTWTSLGGNIILPASSHRCHVIMCHVLVDLRWMLEHDRDGERKSATRKMRKFQKSWKVVKDGFWSVLFWGFEKWGLAYVEFKYTVLSVL